MSLGKRRKHYQLSFPLIGPPTAAEEKHYTSRRRREEDVINLHAFKKGMLYNATTRGLYLFLSIACLCGENGRET